MSAIPLPRVVFGPGDHRHATPGKDIVAHKRALWRAGYFKGPASAFDEEANRKLELAVHQFQADHGLAATGNIGIPTYERLRATPPKDDSAGGRSAYDAVANKLLREFYKSIQESPEDAARRVGVSAAYFWILHTAQIAYAQVRPMKLIKPPKVTPYMDCSWFVTTVYFAADAPDPNDRGYDHQGYTGTLVGNGRQVTAAEAAPMDLFFYGFTTNPTGAFPYGSPTHVAVYLGGGYVGSMGSSAGPVKVRSNYRPVHSVRRYALV